MMNDNNYPSNVELTVVFIIIIVSIVFGIWVVMS